MRKRTALIFLCLTVLKYLFVTCTLPLCKRRWWLASALGIFLISSVIPELVARAHPFDLVENLQPLKSGPCYEAMRATLRKTGFDLPILVVDESRRSREANIFLAGRRGHEYVQVTDNFLQLTGNREPFHRLLIKLAQHELTPLDLPRWQYYLGADHPTFLERIAYGREK